MTDDSPKPPPTVVEQQIARSSTQIEGQHVAWGNSSHGLVPERAKPPPTDLEALARQAREMVGELEIFCEADGTYLCRWDSGAPGLLPLVGVRGPSLEAALRQVIEEEETNG